MMDLLATLIPVLVAGVTQYLVQALKKFVTIVDDFPALVKQLIVVLVAFGLTKASLVLGVTLGTTDLAALGSEDVSALLSAALAFLFHGQAKAKAAEG